MGEPCSHPAWHLVMKPEGVMLEGGDDPNFPGSSAHSISRCLLGWTGSPWQVTRTSPWRGTKQRPCRSPMVDCPGEDRGLQSPGMI